MEELKSKLAEILEEETVGDDDILEEFDYWDSLAILGIISMVSKDYKKVFKAADIRACTTISDLCKLVLD
jgi:acyl carrier protein